MSWGDFLISLFFCLIVINAFGLMVINTQSDLMEGYVQFCDNKYGVMNWSEESYTCGLDICYRCVELKNNQSKEDYGLEADK